MVHRRGESGEGVRSGEGARSGEAGASTPPGSVRRAPHERAALPALAVVAAAAEGLWGTGRVQAGAVTLSPRGNGGGHDAPS